MAEALSQSQIDELLQRMKSGAPVESEPEERIKTYNFASPKKFTKDQLKSLNNFLETFARIVSSYFTNALHSICEVNVSQLEEQRYFEFNNAIPDSTLVGIIGFEPENSSFGETTLLLEFPTSFGYMLIDRLMGGSGEPTILQRDFTEIEIALLDHVMQKVSKTMKDAWQTYFPLETDFKGIQTNGRLIQAFSPQDIVLIVSFDIKEEFYEGTANLCMPADKFEEVIGNLSQKYSQGTRQQDQDKEQKKQELLMDYLKRSDLNIEAYLDRCTMSFEEVTDLRVNDVLMLNKRIDDDIEVHIEGMPWYSARMGESNNRKAIKLVKSLGDPKKDEQREDANVDD
jgi:flagellar motor switch protein FliM